MKKTFKVDVRIKDCDEIFKEGMGPGVIGSCFLEYEIEEKDLESPLFHISVDDKAREFAESFLDYKIEEVDNG